MSKSETARLARYTLVGVCMYLFLKMTRHVETLPSTPRTKMTAYTTEMGTMVESGRWRGPRGRSM